MPTAITSHCQATALSIATNVRCRIIYSCTPWPTASGLLHSNPLYTSPTPSVLNPSQSCPGPIPSHPNLWPHPKLRYPGLSITYCYVPYNDILCDPVLIYFILSSYPLCLSLLSPTMSHAMPCHGGLFSGIDHYSVLCNAAPCYATLWSASSAMQCYAVLFNAIQC